MPISFSVILRIHSVMVSISCVMGIICSVIVIIHSVIFTMMMSSGLDIKRRYKVPNP